MSVAAGAILAGFLAGVTLLIFEGNSLIPIWLGVSTSHATAVLIIVPFALIPREQLARLGPIEITIQLIALVATLLYVFGPGHHLPLSFLPLPVIAWAAFRFPTQVVLLEIAGLALWVFSLTSNGDGPFAHAAELGANGSTLMQIFLLATTALALFATSSQNENRAVTTRLADREQILRGGFVGSRVGLLIVERYRQGFVVLESNEIASAIIERESTTVTDRDGESVTLWDGPLATKIQLVCRQRIDKFSWQTDIDGVRSDVEVLIAKLRSSLGASYSIQFVDVSIARRTAEAQQLALEKEQAHLTELNRQKEEFVASASHELRTPITSIIGYVELLEEEELDDFQRSSVETIARNARRLADLVESLLELGRPLDPNTTVAVSDGTRVATEVIENLAPLAEREDISLTIELGAPLSVAVPAIDLDRILTNLVNNAIKFTPRGGSVRLTLAETDTSAILTVTDSGVGLSAEVMEHIFERFYRAPDAETRGITGTGLGLPLVHGLVMKHYGSINVESEPGEGTTFTVTLPLSKPNVTS